MKEKLTKITSNLDFEFYFVSNLLNTRLTIVKELQAIFK